MEIDRHTYDCNPIWDDSTKHQWIDNPSDSPLCFGTWLITENHAD